MNIKTLSVLGLFFVILIPGLLFYSPLGDLFNYLPHLDDTNLFVFGFFLIVGGFVGLFINSFEGILRFLGLWNELAYQPTVIGVFFVAFCYALILYLLMSLLSIRKNADR